MTVVQRRLRHKTQHRQRPSRTGSIAKKENMRSQVRKRVVDDVMIELSIPGVSRVGFGKAGWVAGELTRSAVADDRCVSVATESVRPGGLEPGAQEEFQF